MESKEKRKFGAIQLILIAGAGAVTFSSRLICDRQQSIMQAKKTITSSIRHRRC